MKMTCERCETVAEPSHVWRRAANLALECSHCGALNRLSARLEAGELEEQPLMSPVPAGSSPEGEAREGHASSRRSEGFAVAASSVPESERMSMEGSGAQSLPAALLPALAFSAVEAERAGQLAPSDCEGVVPVLPSRAEAVAAVQCQKCGHRQHGDDACGRCGFLFANYVEGSMPWERVDDAEALEQAQGLWAEALSAGTAQGHRSFASFCADHGLDEYAGRRYRFRAADRPDDHHARRFLEQLAEQAQLGILSHLESSRLSERATMARRRQIVFWSVLFLGLGVGAFFVFYFPNLFR